MVKLKGSCFVLRPWRESDIEMLPEIASNKKIAKNMFFAFPYPYLIEDAKAWVKAANMKGNQNVGLAIEVEGRLAGGIELELKRGIREGCADGGYWLGEEFWGRGIATEAWSMIRDYAFENFNIRKFNVSAFSWNVPSMRVLEKCGFKKEGVIRESIVRFGEVCDDVKFGMLRSEWERMK